MMSRLMFHRTCCSLCRDPKKINISASTDPKRVKFGYMLCETRTKLLRVAGSGQRRCVGGMVVKQIWASGIEFPMIEILFSRRQPPNYFPRLSQAFPLSLGLSGPQIARI
ncbi:hypothetical protein BT69DRAFT_130304 [Atractiella rhizophila]|nr:hypothetical protein BT69DRAFT_130304 [Atractiella rhizophila]